ncbi:type I polyketide synthase, partial [Streptomyces sp. NPDC059679]|uniref:type I polyketide synthase n=1 Tax=Streptomyces sp. NPDC059679 TaxID=3346903 RepID=UPI0036BB0801
MPETSENPASRTHGSSSEPVAVIGMACRLPGAPSPDAFSRLLRDGVDAITEVPADRWDATAHFAEEPSAPGKTNSRWGGFLDSVDTFDPAFFGISPREAVAMDPQQRLALELGWEALEDAGIVPTTLAGLPVGVFVGAIWDDYATLARRQGLGAISQHTMTGLQRGIIANRLSYVLGLRGPSMTVDTGQSSSLVAVHLACESLRRGETALAVVGGVNLNLVPESAVSIAKFGGMSPDGRCFTFDARANGIVRGEGGGLVVLKRLSEAIADKDRIHCVIHGSAVNNDGGGDGLTAPDQSAQEEVVRQAYRNAGVRTADVQYVELHGTGTRLGDPIEARALGAVLGAGRPADDRLLVGSVKTNIGHLEGAAGIAGLIKAALAIRARELPPSLHFTTPNPDIPLDELRLEVNTEPSPWPSPDRPLIAGISSFGVGGTNCHVVLAEWDGVTGGGASEGGAYGGGAYGGGAADGGTVEGREVLPWVLSAKSAAALKGQARRLLEHIGAQAHGQASVADLGHALVATRAQFTHRAVIRAHDIEGFRAPLAALAAGHPAPGLTQGTALGPTTRTVFVFPGQGSQWVGMAVELMDSSPVFAEHIRRCEETLAPYVDWSLTHVLRGGSETSPELSLDRLDVVHPVLFAVMVSLAAMWRSYGVEPAAVVGHSQGEIAAIHIAGALPLEDAARLVAQRSKAFALLAGQGGMASVALPAAESEELLLSRWSGQLSIAAINGPGTVTVSGDTAALRELVEHCEEHSIRARLLPIDCAGHSAHVERIRRPLLDLLGTVRPASSDIPFYSTVEGRWMDTSELDTEYWYRNSRQTVRFEPAIRALATAGYETFVEVSPHPILAASVQEVIEDVGSAAIVVGSLRRNAGGPDQLMDMLAQVHVHGTPVDWDAAFAGRTTRRAELPTYAFQRRRYWLEAPAAEAADAAHETVQREWDASENTEGNDGAGGDEKVAPAPEAALLEAWAELSDQESHSAALDLVRTYAAIVLGYDAPDDVPSQAAFRELGLDSMLAVQLRNELNAATGLRLPTTVVFDHPTPVALAGFVRSEALGLRATEAGPDAATPRALGALGAGAEDPIAVVGMGCRFPGGVVSPEDLWRLVVSGGDAVSGFPEDRGWDLEGLFDPDPDASGKSYVREAGFLHAAGEFDAGFFGISPREALAMDPQQRLLLET